MVAKFPVCLRDVVNDIWVMLESQRPLEEFDRFLIFQSLVEQLPLIKLGKKIDRLPSIGWRTIRTGLDCQCVRAKNAREKDEGPMRMSNVVHEPSVAISRGAPVRRRCRWFAAVAPVPSWGEHSRLALVVPASWPQQEL